jgi:hypothetical protein
MISGIVLALTTGFVNLPQLVAAHPLAPVLEQYDREIEALRSTQRVAGLSAIARDAANDARAAKIQTDDARARVQQLAAANGRYDQREAGVLERLATDEAPSEARYRSSARDAGAAALASYRAAMAARTTRALLARRQQLDEAESTLAYDLKKQDAGHRLMIELKLRDLHLSAPQRAQLRAQLRALDAREAAKVAALRSADASTLAAYGATLRAQESADDARMAAEIARSTAANVAARARMSTATPDLGALRGYHFSADTADIAGALNAAGNDFMQRFAALGSIDRSSRSATDARIEQIEANRAALYKSIVAQITVAAKGLAASRHLGNVYVGTTAPRNAVNLTDAVRSKLRAMSP